MIEFSDVTLTYADSDAPTLRGVDLRIAPGELALVIGRTGSGKSTLLQLVNGLVPRFTGGLLRGAVRVDGRSTADHAPRELASVVGYVGQDPLAGFVTEIVEDELAYGMEQLRLAPDVMRTRVEETLDLLGIADLRSRALRDLSGGQQQRVAIGSVLTCHPQVLVLDEPTSALDPTAAEEVLAAITRLVHDLGITVLIAEHRLERVVQYADVVVEVAADGTVRCGPPAEILATSAVAPPVVELGRLVGWQPLPLSVRDARRVAGQLAEELQSLRAPSPSPVARGAVQVRGLDVTYGSVVAVDQVSLEIGAGEVVVLMGRNGSGKSSLLWAMAGAGPRSGGTVLVETSERGPGGPAASDPAASDPAASDPADLDPAAARRLVGLVPQTSSDLLYLSSVEAECIESDRSAGLDSGTTLRCFERFAGLGEGAVDVALHPRDLSEGQRLALVLAIQLVAAPPVVLLDEPTRGLDYGAKATLAATLTALAEAGHAVVVSSHDVEFVAGVAHRVMVMAQGEIVAEGPTPDVVGASPMFAPQIAKVLAPQRWLTVNEVADALGH